MGIVKVFFFLTIVLHSFTSKGQDTSYARYVIDELCSEKFAGRGYVNDGDKKAAEFIAKEFASAGLEQIKGSWFQAFSFPVNTFPSKMKVKAGKNSLIAGKDFIVHPASASSKKTFITKVLKKYSGAFDLTDADGKCFVVFKDSLTAEDYKSLQADLYKKVITKGAFIFSEPKKLTWSVSTDQFAVPVITVLQSQLTIPGEEVFIHIESKLNNKHQTQNVIGCVKATVPTDSFIVFTAHYDHLGRMGKEIYFPGANDNASGTSMMLNLAKYYSKNRDKVSYNILFIAFAGEEAGLIGSEFYTENPLLPLNKIKLLINMDLMGTGDDGMMVVNATEFKQEFELLKKINTEKGYVVKLGERGKAKNSDHYYFSEKGVPSFFFYTMGGISAYHDVYDISATLPLTDYSDIFKLITDFCNQIK